MAEYMADPLTRFGKFVVSEGNKVIFAMAVSKRKDDDKFEIKQLRKRFKLRILKMVDVCGCRSFAIHKWDVKKHLLDVASSLLDYGFLLSWNNGLSMILRPGDNITGDHFVQEYFMNLLKEKMKFAHPRVVCGIWLSSMPILTSPEF